MPRLQAWRSSNMTKDELIAFLKENLSVRLTVQQEYDSYGRDEKTYEVRVGLFIDQEEISTSYDRFDT